MTRVPLNAEQGPAAEAEVDVWAMSLDVDEAALERLGSLLSFDERERAARFRFPRDRDRYIAGRGFLREILADYCTGAAAESIRFSYSHYGKPRISSGYGIEFNVSHSEDRMLVAVTRSCAVGVDVEVMSSRHADELVAERFFSAREVRDLKSLPAGDRARAFLTCWTRKEAFIKARGEGLSLPLQEFDVTLTPGAPPRLVRTAWSAREPAEWLLIDLSADCDGCVAALALHALRAAVSVRPYGCESNEPGVPVLAGCSP